MDINTKEIFVFETDIKPKQHKMPPKPSVQKEKIKMELIIPGTPIAKKRPRFARRGKFTAAINDQKTEEGKFLFHVMQQTKEKLHGPLTVEIGFYFRRPKSHFGTGRNAGELKPSSPKYHTVTPDVDNLVKFAFDCLNEVWEDDAKVIRCIAEKTYSDEPRTEIYIREID